MRANSKNWDKWPTKWPLNLFAAKTDHLVQNRRLCFFIYEVNMSVENVTGGADVS